MENRVDPGRTVSHSETLRRGHGERRRRRDECECGIRNGKERETEET
jgi:hypothetical protein